MFTAGQTDRLCPRPLPPPCWLASPARVSTRRGAVLDWSSGHRCTIVRRRRQPDLVVLVVLVVVGQNLLGAPRVLNRGFGWACLALIDCALPVDNTHDELIAFVRALASLIFVDPQASRAPIHGLRDASCFKIDPHIWRVSCIYSQESRRRRLWGKPRSRRWPRYESCPASDKQKHIMIVYVFNAWLVLFSHCRSGPKTWDFHRHRNIYLTISHTIFSAHRRVTAVVQHFHRWAELMTEHGGWSRPALATSAPDLGINSIGRQRFGPIDLSFAICRRKKQ